MAPPDPYDLLTAQGLLALAEQARTQAQELTELLAPRAVSADQLGVIERNQFIKVRGQLQDDARTYEEDAAQRRRADATEASDRPPKTRVKQRASDTRCRSTRWTTLVDEAVYGSVDDRVLA